MAETQNVQSNNKHEKLKKIKDGFHINFMKMKDGSQGKVLWQCNEWDIHAEYREEHLPKEILECKEVVREINFSSKESIEQLELIQNYYIKDELVESSRFYFGFVIPNSTNNWDQTVEAKEEMIPCHILSGNLLVETIFLSGDYLISKSNILIYYD